MKNLMIAIVFSMGLLLIVLTVMGEVLGPYCDGAEILVKARPHWMEIADTTGWLQEKLDVKNRIIGKGCPVSIRPDGWNWGALERPPGFILIKLVRADTSNHVTKAQIKHYLGGLRDSTQNRLKTRKYKVPEVLVDSVLNHYGGAITITPAKLISVIKEYEQDGSGW